MSADQIAAALKKNPGWVSDLELCRIIDNELISQFHVSSYAHLTKLEICDILRDDLHYLLPDKQIARCLAIDVESVRKRRWWRKGTFPVTFQSTKIRNTCGKSIGRSGIEGMTGSNRDTGWILISGRHKDNLRKD